MGFWVFEGFWVFGKVGWEGALWPMRERAEFFFANSFWFKWYQMVMFMESCKMFGVGNVFYLNESWFSGLALSVIFC